MAVYVNGIHVVRRNEKRPNQLARRDGEVLDKGLVSVGESRCASRRLAVIQVAAVE